MPPRRDPPVYNLAIRTHKLAVHLATPSSAPVSSLVPRALSALAQYAGKLDALPKGVDAAALTEDDVALARCERDGRGRRVQGQYEKLDGRKSVKEALYNWEDVFLMFRDPDGHFKVVVSFPPISQDDEDEPMLPALPTAGASNKRKGAPI